MARSVDAEIAVEATLQPPSGRMPPVRRAGGGLSLGGTVGASDHGAVGRGGESGGGHELAGNGPPVRLELAERGDAREAGCGVRVETPCASTGACHWH